MAKDSRSPGKSNPNFDWSAFYEMVRSVGPSETVRLALEHIDREKRPRKKIWRAVDLGCGEGRDALELLKRGWRVVAIDNTPSACAAVKAKAGALEIDTQLTVKEGSFETVSFGKADLISASLALPFCPPERFARLWSKILKSLQPGGYLACNLFGDRHDWARYPYLCSFTRSEVDGLLKDLSVIQFTERERPSRVADGTTVACHAYAILAQKC